jgi:hypothetical protein
MILKNIFAKKCGDFASFLQKNVVRTWRFETNTIFSPKIGKTRRKW